MNNVKALGDFMKRIATEKAALAESAGSTGGYLVPQEIALAVDERWHEFGVFKRLARNQPMKSRECDVPSFDFGFAHASGASPLFGGMTAKWTTEGTAIAAGEPAFANSKLVAKDLIVGVAASNQLVADGGEALGNFLSAQFALVVDWVVEAACFNGDGLGKPLGVTRSAATVTVTRAAADDVQQVDLSKMLAALLPGCWANAIWCVNPSAVQKVAALGNFSWFNYKHDHPRLFGFLYGRPVYATEKLPVLGKKGDVVLMDPTMYVLGQRGYEVVASQHPKFLTNQTVFKLWWRGDGTTIPRNTATTADGTSPIGAFVVLSGAESGDGGGGGGGLPVI